jgi:Nickel responsive protein SCO4226-like
VTLRCRGFGNTTTRREGELARFLIERNFAEEVAIDKDGAEQIRRINDEEGVRWLFSFLSPDKRKTYCLYEAASADAIRIAARRLNIPADVVIEVSEVRPEMFA